MGSRVPLDDLLAPVRVRFNFDSGFPARPEWRDCLGWNSHPVGARARRNAETLISVGATLRVRPPAFTMVAGRYGFGTWEINSMYKALSSAITNIRRASNWVTFPWWRARISAKEKSWSLATPARFKMARCRTATRHL